MNILRYFLAIFSPILLRTLFNYQVYFWTATPPFFWLLVFKSFNYCGYLPSVNYSWQIFSSIHSVGLFLSLADLFFSCTEAFCFVLYNEDPLLVVEPMESYSGSSFLLLMFCSSGYTVSCFTFRPLTHVELVLVQEDRYGSNFILLHADTQFSKHYCWRCFLFTSLCFCHLC